jgi:hypothetical protein
MMITKHPIDSTSLPLLPFRYLHTGHSPDSLDHLLPVLPGTARVRVHVILRHLPSRITNASARYSHHCKDSKGELFFVTTFCEVQSPSPFPSCAWSSSMKDLLSILWPDCRLTLSTVPSPLAKVSEYCSSCGEYYALTYIMKHPKNLGWMGCSRV